MNNGLEIVGAQSFTSLMADLCQDINGVCVQVRNMKMVFNISTLGVELGNEH